MIPQMSQLRAGSPSSGGSVLVLSSGRTGRRDAAHPNSAFLPQKRRKTEKVTQCRVFGEKQFLRGFFVSGKTRCKTLRNWLQKFPENLRYARKRSAARRHHHSRSLHTGYFRRWRLLPDKCCALYLTERKSMKRIRFSWKIKIDVLSFKFSNILRKPYIYIIDRRLNGYYVEYISLSKSYSMQKYCSCNSGGYSNCCTLEE